MSRDDGVSGRDAVSRHDECQDVTLCRDMTSVSGCDAVSRHATMSRREIVNVIIFPFQPVE